MSILILTLLNFPSFAAKSQIFLDSRFAPFYHKKSSIISVNLQKNCLLYIKKKHITFFILQTLIFGTRLNEQYNLGGITLN